MRHRTGSATRSTLGSASLRFVVELIGSLLVQSLDLELKVRRGGPLVLVGEPEALRLSGYSELPLLVSVGALLSSLLRLGAGRPVEESIAALRWVLELACHWIRMLFLIDHHYSRNLAGIWI